MEKGQHPNSRKNLKSFVAGDPRTTECAKKGAKAKNDKYRSLRDVFRQELTEENKQKILNVVTNMALEGNLQALDRLVTILGDSSSTQVNVEAQVGGGVIMMERQEDGDK